MTSRHSDSENLASDNNNAIELPGLPESAALQLLWAYIRRKPSDQEAEASDARKIIQKLAYHPLAIIQAGSYIYQHRLSRLGQFMDHYNTKRDKILKYTPRLSEYRRRLTPSEKETPLNVFTTWELSFQLLLDEDCGQPKSELLTLFSFFNSNDISEEHFATYYRCAQEGEGYAWPIPCLEQYCEEQSRSPPQFETVKDNDQARSSMQN